MSSHETFFSPVWSSISVHLTDSVVTLVTLVHSRQKIKVEFTFSPQYQSQLLLKTVVVLLNKCRFFLYEASSVAELALFGGSSSASGGIVIKTFSEHFFLT